MLWIALHFPSLSLEIFSRGNAEPGPLAVAERQGSRTWVTQCNEAARANGVQPGMSATAAQALASNLIVRMRDPVAEADALSGIASWAGKFTPSVSLQPPDGLLLEVASCLKLHRGFDRLLSRVRNGLAGIGYAFRYASASTPHGAWLLALAGKSAIVDDARQLERELACLPVQLLKQPDEVVAGLEMIGAYTLADCLQLPRAGVARRFGSALLEEMDRALGRLPEPRKFFVPPPVYERKLELPAQVSEAEGLLFAARRLLPELEGYLNLREAGVNEIALVCRHDDIADTVVRTGFAKPTRALERMLLLLRETLGRTRLPAPVHAIVLCAVGILPLDACNLDLFQDEAGSADALLLDRLRIRLGQDAVFGLAPVCDHRPEQAWMRCRAGEVTGHGSAVRRPLWLLPEPVSCQRDRLTLQSAPERIESGWWDGGDVARDYYVALHRSGSQLWVYRERGSGCWYVHGLFA